LSKEKCHKLQQLKKKEYSEIYNTHLIGSGEVKKPIEIHHKGGQVVCDILGRLLINPY
jgi:hypothetical protein